MRSITICLAAVLFLSLIKPSGAEPRKAPFVPPPGKTLLIVGQDRDTIAWYVHATGKVPGGTMFYTSIQKMDGFDEPVDYGGGSMDGDVLLRTYPNSVIQLGLYMVDGLANTIVGGYDANLTALAQWIKQANRPVYLRIGYEFDNPSNHYDPQQYIQAFRYVVDFLRRQGVKNAAYVWHTDLGDHPGAQWQDWYPGDDYVDWFGVSIFETTQVPMAAKFQKLAQEHGKPFMICESSPWHMYTARDKTYWLNRIFKFIKEQDVKIFSYIDCNWNTQDLWRNLNLGDARLEKTKETKDLWLNETAHDRYLKASPNLFQILGWIPSKT
jgi:Glycosyl hydrolase family 26